MEFGAAMTAIVLGAAALGASLVVAARSIILKRRAEQARAELAKSQARLAEAQRIGKMGSWQWDVRSNELTWSEQVFDIFGLERTAAPTYERYLACVHPEDRPALVKAINAALFENAPYGTRHRIVRPDGEVRTLEARGEVEFGPAGEPVKMFGTCQCVSDLVRLQQAAEEGRRKQREILDSLFTFVGLMSRDGDLIDANRAAIEGLGLTREGVVGRKFWDAFYWSYAPAIQAAMKDAVARAAQGEVVRGDYLARVGEGKFITVDATFGPLRDAQGRITEVIGSAVDVTERVEAEQASQRVRAQLEQAQRIANIGSWEWDLASGKLDWSEHCFRLIGWSQADGAPTIGRFMGILHPDDRATTEQTICDAIERGASCDYSHRILWPSGEERVLHQLGEVTFDAKGQPARMIGTTQDVTELHAARRELIESKLRAEAANRAKSQFVANMSHELRTPLNAIIGFSELLLAEDTGFSEERRREYARDIHVSGKHLLAVINDILDISRIEAGKVSLDEDEVATDELVEAALRMVRPRAEETGVAVSRTGAGDLKLNADRRLLLQALLNLASNAVKFTEAGGRVEISTSVSADGGAAIAVADTGIGMSAADVARVGEPFLQADGRLTRKFEGTGLGLVIAKRLIEMHGGVLDIDSTPGRGTTMTIRLPARRTRDTGDGHAGEGHAGEGHAGDGRAAAAC